MEYHGKLYGHLCGKMYFDTGKTSEDWDALEKRVGELEAENKAHTINEILSKLNDMIIEAQSQSEILRGVGMEYAAECSAAMAMAYKIAKEMIQELNN